MKDIVGTYILISSKIVRETPLNDTVRVVIQINYQLITKEIGTIHRTFFSYQITLLACSVFMRFEAR